MEQRKWLRDRLASRKTVLAAGAYDALSARMIEGAKFDAVMTTGFGISASFLGKPDVELYTMTENLAVVRQVVSSVNVPVIADCDTGYGNAVNVMRTVREFEQAGVSAGLGFLTLTFGSSFRGQRSRKAGISRCIPDSRQVACPRDNEGPTFQKNGPIEADAAPRVQAMLSL